MGLSYHYAFDAAQLLIGSLAHLQEVIESDEQSSRGFYMSFTSLYDMKKRRWFKRNISSSVTFSAS